MKMKPQDHERIAQLVKLIQSEQDSPTLLNLMEELNNLLGDAEAEQALLRAGKSAMT